LTDFIRAWPCNRSVIQQSKLTIKLKVAVFHSTSTKTQ